MNGTPPLRRSGSGAAILPRAKSQGFDSLLSVRVRATQPRNACTVAARPLAANLRITQKAIVETFLSTAEAQQPCHLEASPQGYKNPYPDRARYGVSHASVQS